MPRERRYQADAGYQLPSPVTPSARSTKRAFLYQTSDFEARHVGKILPLPQGPPSGADRPSWTVDLRRKAPPRPGSAFPSCTSPFFTGRRFHFMTLAFSRILRPFLCAPSPTSVASPGLLAQPAQPGSRSPNPADFLGRRAALSPSFRPRPPGPVWAISGSDFDPCRTHKPLA